MNEKKASFDLSPIAGVLFGVAALELLLNVFRLMGYYFNFKGLLIALALGFFAAVLLMKRRDNLLLIAAGVFALVELLFGGLIGFVGAALLLVVVLVKATPYLPQLDELVKKAWFVPAIVALLGNMLAIYSFGALLHALCLGAGTLLCCLWLAHPDGLPKKDAASANTASVDAGPVAVSAPAVDGYCELFKHVLLLLLTFGIWNLIWIYRMTGYLNRVGGEKERTPVAELLLCLFVPFYMVYWTYKSALRVDRLAGVVGVNSRLGTLCLLLAAMLPIVAPVVLQDKINTIIDVERGARAKDFDPAQKPVVKMKAPVEIMDGYCGLFKHLLLLVLTCGIWNFIWIYRTTAYLNRVKGEEQRNPVTKLLLCMFVPLYAVYWNYKSAQRIDKLAAEVGVKSDLGVLCLILSMVVALVPQVLMQDKINEIIAAENAMVVSDESAPVAATPVSAVEEAAAALLAEVKTEDKEVDKEPSDKI